VIGVKTSVKKDGSGSQALKDGIQEAFLDAADSGFERSQELVAQNSTDTGKLLGGGIQPKVMPDGSIEWGYVPEYAAYVEFGTPPHWVPIEPLKGWARRVLGDEGVAYDVQKGIAENGTDPQPFFRPGVETMRTRLKAINVESRVRDNL